MPSVIQNILGRATISDYKKFVPNSIIDLINLSEQSPPNYELVKVICEVMTLESILLETAGIGRKCILNHIQR